MSFDARPTPIQCPVCGAPGTAEIYRVIDVQHRPQLKSLLLTNRFNMYTCPNCQRTSALAVPFLYHDADKELALIFLPMQAGQNNADQQRLIGQLTQTVMNALSPEQRKAYLLQPRQFFTFQSLVEEVLKADGVTPEMMAEQQVQVDLLNRMVDATDDTVLDVIIKENDSQIDYAFFQLVSIQLNVVESSQQVGAVQRLSHVYDRLVELSSIGQKIKGQAEAIDALSANPTRDTLLEQLLHVDDASTREALISVGRSLLDYPFFQKLTALIDAAKKSGDTAESERLTALRKEILGIRDRIDAQMRQHAEQRAALLNKLLLSKDLEKDIEANADGIDDLFFDVLTNNLQRAQQANDMGTFNRLQEIATATLRFAQRMQPPEVQFVNALIAAEYPDQTRTLLERNRQVLSSEFVGWLDNVVEELRGDGRTESADRLQQAVGLAREVSGLAVTK